MHSQPTGNMKSMGGPYKTQAEAHKAMAEECTSSEHPIGVAG
jgi:hypothetical protein